jgi:transcriptional regulator with XRE-family HTH domain
MTTNREKPAWIPANTFGLRLVQVRVARGLSQVEAAQICGLDDGSWSNWERGTTPRRMDRVVQKIHDGLGVDRNWLMFGDPPQDTRASFTEDGKEAPIMLDMSPDARGLQLVAP